MTDTRTTQGLLHSTWHLDNKYGASFYIASALTPTDFTLDRADYEKTRDQYQPFETYFDGDHGNMVIFYDTQAQLDAHAEMAEADDLAATMHDATVYGQ